MKTSLLALGVVLMCAAGANAQSTPTTPAPAVATATAHDCINTTDNMAWASLSLTADQTKRVQDIQANCRKECEAMKTKGTTDHAVMENHEAQLKTVLSADQYNKWVAWCNGRPTKAEMKT